MLICFEPRLRVADQREKLFLFHWLKIGCLPLESQTEQVLILKNRLALMTLLKIYQLHTRVSNNHREAAP